MVHSTLQNYLYIWFNHILSLTIKKRSTISRNRFLHVKLSITVMGDPFVSTYCLPYTSLQSHDTAVPLPGRIHRVNPYKSSRSRTYLRSNRVAQLRTPTLPILIIRVIFFSFLACLVLGCLSLVSHKETVHPTSCNNLTTRQYHRFHVIHDEKFMIFGSYLHFKQADVPTYILPFFGSNTIPWFHLYIYIFRRKHQSSWLIIPRKKKKNNSPDIQVTLARKHPIEIKHSNMDKIIRRNEHSYNPSN